MVSASELGRRRGWTQPPHTPRAAARLGGRADFDIALATVHDPRVALARYLSRHRDAQPLAADLRVWLAAGVRADAEVRVTSAVAPRAVDATDGRRAPVSRAAANALASPEAPR